MSLVDAINTAQTEYNQCINRQQKLLSDLKQKRSDKLKNQLQNNASILNLVELWKEQETREKMVKLAELRKKTLKDEVQRLSDMDELKSRVLGMSEGEVLNG
jgi:adenylosuccinate synthase